MIEKLKKDIFFSLTLGLIAFHVIANAIWIFLNRLPPPDDAASHTMTSFRFIDYLMHHFSDFDWHQFLTISDYYPPFAQFVGTLIGFIDPYNYKIIQLTGTLFFSLAILFLYLFTKENTKNNAVAFLSAFFFSFFLYFFKESRDHMTDIPLVALFLAGIYFLKLSNNFKNLKHTLLFFLCFSLACLTRWTAPVYFLIPILFQAIPILKSLFTDKKAFLGFFIGIVLFMVILFPWYSTNYQNIIKGAFTYSAANKDNPTNVFSVESIVFYPKLIIIFQLSLLGFIFLCASFIPNAIHMRRRFFLEVIGTIVFCYIIFTFFFGNKIIRYLFPIMPFFAILLGNGAQLFFKRYQLVSPLATIVIAYYLIAYFILSFGIPLYPQAKYAIKINPLGYTDVYYLDHDPVKLIYEKNEWKNAEIASILNKATLNNTKKIYYFVNSTRPYLNNSTINIELYKTNHGAPLNIDEGFRFFLDVLGGRSTFANNQELDEFANSIDVFFIPEKEIGPEAAVLDIVQRKQVREYMLNNTNPNFSETQVIQLPDGDNLHVYQRKDTTN